MSQNNDVWHQTLAQLRLQMTRAAFDTWLNNSKLITVQDDVYTIEATSSMAVDRLENRLKEAIVRTLTGVVGGLVEVKFVAREQAAYTPLDNFDEPEESEEPDTEFEGFTTTSVLLSFSQIRFRFTRNILSVNGGHCLGQRYLN